MHVVHLYNRFDHTAGGIVTALDGLTRAQAKAGIDTHLIITMIEGEDISLTEQLAEHNIDVQIIGPCVTSLRRHRQLRPTVERSISNADVVHIHGVWEEIQHVGARAAQQADVPYLISPHGMLDPYSLRQKRLKKLLYLQWRLQKNIDRATVVHCTTQTEATLASPLMRRTEALIESLGLNLHEFKTLPAEGAFRKRIGVTADQKLLLFMSRIHAKKGLDILIPAFAAAGADDTVLVIAGPDEGGHKALIEKLVESYGIGDRVLFPGMLYERERLEALIDADLFILPSYQENFGIVVIESLAAGTPVLISDQVNLHGDVTTAQVGEVAPTDADRFADLVRRWLANDDMRLEAAQRARPFALDNYDWDVIAEHWVQHYQRIADR